jgi:hypothetical protein
LNLPVGNLSVTPILYHSDTDCDADFEGDGGDKSLLGITLYVHDRMSTIPLVFARSL